MVEPLYIDEIHADGAGAAKVANISSSISAATNIGASIFSTLANISDQKKRRLFEQNLATLSLDQQKKLERELMDANSESQRLAILSNALTQVNLQRITGVAELYAQQERAKRNQQLIIGGVLIFGGILAVYVVTKIN